MTSLQRTRVNGTTYWRIVESRRVDGKPRAIPVLQLGTADALLARLCQAGPAGVLRLRSYEHGAVAALTAIAQRLDLAGIIDRHVGSTTRQGLSVGKTLVLAACNRAILPRSKRGWAAWAQRTSLTQLHPGLKPRKLTSQFFWDQMDKVPITTLAAIERDLTKAIVADLGITLDTLCYDTTNFFTFIDSTNTHCDLPQRGHRKQERSDLRLVNLALLVSRDGQIPLCSQLYPGNQAAVADVTAFPPALTRIRQRLADLSLDLEDVTLVYDRGNLSRKNQEIIDEATMGYVSALIPNHHKELIAIPVAQYQAITAGTLTGLLVHRRSAEIWGRERTVVFYISEKLRAGQRRGLDLALAKATRVLTAWRERLGKKRSGARSTRTAERRIERILSAQYLKLVLRIIYDPTKAGTQGINWSIDQPAYDRLCQEYFGKRMLVTNREQWSSEEIILAYRGQSRVESTFRQLKDDEHFALRPQYHWTDQKLHVHAFIRFLALLMGRVIEREARRLGRTESLSRLMDDLSSVRLALILTNSGMKAGRPRCQWQLEEADTRCLELFTALVPQKPPFVYTQK